MTLRHGVASKRDVIIYNIETMIDFSGLHKLNSQVTKNISQFNISASSDEWINKVEFVASWRDAMIVSWCHDHYMK